MDEEFVLWPFRTVRIYVVKHREIRIKGHSVVIELLLEALGVRDGECHAVYADFVAFVCVLGNPVYKVDRIRTILFHHFEAGAFKLSFGLYKIAGVCPAESFIGGHYRRAVSAVF